MKSLRSYGGIDQFRLIAAFLIVGIHTYPLASVSTELNFVFVHVLARIAVPFFLMATGYFLLPKAFNNDNHDMKPLLRFVTKTALLYAGATLLYLPISIYAGQYSNVNIFTIFIRNILFDGTFYHLWYLPAAIIGALLVYALCRRFSLRIVISITLVLYIIGLLGDNYWGITSEIPFLRTAYDAGFQLFSFTRNGLFYAPVFLAMGAVIAKREHQMQQRTNIIGFVLCMALMLTEGILLNNFGSPRHSSMYIALLPCMFFLFQLICNRNGKRSLFMRDVSMWIYILHPLFIIGVRGIGRITNLTNILVGNSVLFYLAVCGLSFAAAAFITSWKLRKKPVARDAVLSN
ncbi:MAG: acyltransferase [Oscillospiraceae bacterium]|nr:acyltransferase [Oscillospiraceae bacterium]